MNYKNEARRERSNARLLRAYGNIMEACAAALEGTPDRDTLEGVIECLSREGRLIKEDAFQYSVRARILEGK